MRQLLSMSLILSSWQRGPIAGIGLERGIDSTSPC